MQAETMPASHGGKSMTEYSRQVFGRDANAIVGDGDFQMVTTMAERDTENLFLLARFIASPLGVTDQVHQNLQHLVLIHGDFRKVRVKIADDLHLVAFQ